MSREPIGGRTAAAAVLIVAALAALLIGWFGSGWAGVRAEQRALRRAAHDEGERTVRELAAALDARLDDLRRSEAQRPYYHYQSLYHDPRGAAQGLAVVPSPLASGPEDALVRAHFQIDGDGRVSMPTLNDEVPELSASDDLAENRTLRVALAAAAPGLRVAERPVAVAAAPPPEPPPQVAMADTKLAEPEKPLARYRTKKTKGPAPPSKVVVQVDPDVYAQNAMATDIFKQARNEQAPPQQMAAPPPPPARRPVEIAVGPLEWRVADVAGEHAVALVRRVDTPDGSMTQGMVLDRAALADWLAERAEGRPVSLVPKGATRADDPTVAAVPLAVGAWSVALDVHPEAARAAAAIDAVAAGFLGRFVPIAFLAVACGGLVALVVARAERMARQRARFAAAAAHELRTPLAGLQLYGDMLADGLGDPAKSRDYARRMAEEASRLGRVVSNVLGFSQLERGNLSVRPVAADAAAVVRAAVERARPALERAGAAVVLDEGEPAEARLDEDAVLRILGNLLDNAEKYGRGAADRAVHVAVARRGDAVEIAVADRGPGVAERHRRRLFRPFWRGAGSDGPAGLGLGLALSRSLARAMGGDLVHRATAGGGATFVLILPTA